jgi:hypothetical protein
MRVAWRSRLLVTAKTLAINLRWGLSWAFAFAAVYVVWVTVLFAIGGQEAFARKHVTYEGTVLTYLESALGAGFMLGLLRPLNRSRPGSVLIGFATGAAIGLTGGLAIEPSGGIDGAHIALGVMIGLLGAIVAFKWSAPNGGKVTGSHMR